MSKVVLDASAILAFLDDEPGAETVFAVLSKAFISTVNLAEVHSKLAERGRDAGDAMSLIARPSMGCFRSRRALRN